MPSNILDFQTDARIMKLHENFKWSTHVLFS